MTREEREERLRNYYNKLISKLNPNKPVYFYSSVIDCEHSGDIFHEEMSVRRFIEPFGGEITDTYWDGNDCGEAWVECKIPFNKENIWKMLNHGDFYGEYQK